MCVCCLLFVCAVLLCCSAVLLQSKVMLRVEEPDSDFVRLLVRTVALPPPAAATEAAAAATEAAAGHGSTHATPQDGTAEDLPAAQEGLTADADGNSGSAAAAEAVVGAAGSGEEQQASQLQLPPPALSPAAVEALLSSQAGCEVLLQEESRWLVVSETCSPGGICRWMRAVD